jgi:hypothetical protein
MVKSVLSFGVNILVSKPILNNDPHSFKPKRLRNLLADSSLNQIIDLQLQTFILFIIKWSHLNIISYLY